MNKKLNNIEKCELLYTLLSDYYKIVLNYTSHEHISDKIILREYIAKDYEDFVDQFINDERNYKDEKTEHYNFYPIFHRDNFMFEPILNNIDPNNIFKKDEIRKHMLEKFIKSPFNLNCIEKNNRNIFICIDTYLISEKSFISMNDFITKRFIPESKINLQQKAMINYFKNQIDPIEHLSLLKKISRNYYQIKIISNYIHQPDYHGGCTNSRSFIVKNYDNFIDQFLQTTNKDNIEYMREILKTDFDHDLQDEKIMFYKYPNPIFTNPYVGYEYYNKNNEEKYFGYYYKNKKIFFKLYYEIEITTIFTNDRILINDFIKK